MTTAEEFKNARFATHPDGRIAARIDPDDSLPWIAQMPRRGRAYRTDKDMAADGWSPLDESRPSEGTISILENGISAAERWNEAQRRLAALSAARAVTTDEDDPSVDYHAMWWKAEREREQAEAFAALWKETARRAMQRARRDAQLIPAYARLDLWVALGNDSNDFEDTDPDWAELNATVREAIREAEELGKALDNVKPMDTMTAREHLDAAWDAAHVPADGTIPAWTPFLFRTEHGTDRRVSMSTGAPDDLPTNSVAGERRLLDPPTPVVSYTQRLALELENAGWIREGGAEGVAEHLDALGVRAPEDTEKENER